MVIKRTRSDLIFDTVNNIIMIISLLLVAYPLIFIISASFSNPADVQNGTMWLLPTHVTLEGYKTLFRTGDIWIGYKNTIIYAVFGTMINLVCTVSSGYALSRKDFMIRGFIMKFFSLTMFFSGGLIPTYLLMKSFGFLDTIWAMIIPGAVSVYNMVMCRTFFQMTIPDELLEAAQVDGCGDFRFFAMIVIPLSGALIAVMVLFFAVGHWNTYFNGLIYLTDRKKYSLQMVLQEILVNQNMSQVDSSLSSMDVTESLRRQRLADSIKYGVIIVGSLPVLLLYPLIQKYFVKGIIVGSIKG